MTFTRASMLTTAGLLLLASLGTTVIYQSVGHISWYELLIGQKIFYLPFIVFYRSNFDFGGPYRWCDYRLYY